MPKPHQEIEKFNTQLFIWSFAFWKAAQKPIHSQKIFHKSENITQYIEHVKGTFTATLTPWFVSDSLRFKNEPEWISTNFFYQAYLPLL